MKIKILIIEDETDIRELLVYNLEKEGFDVAQANSGLEGLKLLPREEPQLVLLDLMLPDIPGEEVCKRIRRDPRYGEVAIIMLTAKAAETDKILGLKRGADDYVTKPFSLRELTERIKAVLRRTQGLDTARIFTAGTLYLDFDRHEARIGTEKLDLTSQEMQIFQLLAQAKGKVISRERILDNLWGAAPDVDSRAIDAAIKRLRAKMGQHRNLIETVKGVGYRIKASDL